jgi:LEA14-like dessication related protein
MNIRVQVSVLSRMSRFRRIAIPLTALGAVACGPFWGQGIERPSVELAAIDITGLGLQGGTMDLLLDVHNPNSFELRATRIRVGIYLEGTHFGDAMLSRAPILPAGETTRIPVPVAFSWSGIGSGARGLLSRGGAQYRLDGRLDLDTPFGTRGVDVEAEGRVTMRNLVGR